MNRKVLLTGILALVAGVFATIPLPAQEKLWSVHERKVPVPSAASDELRKVLLAASPPDVVEASRFSPKGDREWITQGEQVDTETAKETQELARKFAVTVKSGEIAGVPVHYVTPANVPPEHQTHLFIHLHGGAYVYGKGKAGAAEAVLVAFHTRRQVISIDYRMPPKHPFPAAVDDVVSVFQQLLKSRPAESMALGGTSAGGGLTLATTHKLIELGLATPAALFAGTPWADLTKTGDTHFTNEGIDHVLVTYSGLLAHAAKLYAGKLDLKHPLISPVYGDFKSFPPTYLVSGTRDLFLSDTARVHRKMRVAGVSADLNVYEGMSHADYTFSDNLPESHQVYRELSEFLTKHLP